MPDTPSPLALIESKLVPPQLAPGLLARSQLSTLLHTGLHKRLVGVAAAAGYGKTTALAQFVSQTEPLGITTAWLSLDAEDNDPLRFMRYLAAALHHADASLGRGALAQTDGGSLVSLDAIAAALLQDLLEARTRLLSRLQPAAGELADVLACARRRAPESPVAATWFNLLDDERAWTLALAAQPKAIGAAPSCVSLARRYTWLMQAGQAMQPWDQRQRLQVCRSEGEGEFVSCNGLSHLAFP